MSDKFHNLTSGQYNKNKRGLNKNILMKFMKREKDLPEVTHRKKTMVSGQPKTSVAKSVSQETKHFTDDLDNEIVDKIDSVFNKLSKDGEKLKQLSPNILKLPIDNDTFNKIKTRYLSLNDSKI